MSHEFPFVPATRQGSKLRAGIDGPAGSGKTYTLLAVATAMASVSGDTIGLIDTERGSAGKYAPPFKFMHQKWQGAYEPQRLIRCLAEAADGGIGILLLDTWSRFWGGVGGMLEQVDRVASSGLSGWKAMRPIENEMIEAMLAYPGHLMVTMRVKTAFEIGRDANTGKATMQRVGLKPDQREGMEYEFDIVGDMDTENMLSITKSRCPGLTGRTFNKPGTDLAQIIMDWLTTCEDTRTAIEYRDAALEPGASFEDIKKLRADAAADGLLGAALIDEHGDLANLGDFLYRRGVEARAAEQPAPQPVAVATTPAPAQPAIAPAAAAVDRLRKNGPPPPAASPPASTAPVVMTDPAWLTQVTTSIAHLPLGPSQRANNLINKVNGQAKGDGLAPGDREHLLSLIDGKVKAQAAA